jgi:hypothetical protein
MKKIEKHTGAYFVRYSFPISYSWNQLLSILTCKKSRQFLQAPKLTFETLLDHCLNRIRATLMWHPDLSSLTTFFWDDEPQPKVNGTKTLHDCIDWNSMMASARYRIVDHEEIASLKNPRH